MTIPPDFPIEAARELLELVEQTTPGPWDAQLSDTHMFPHVWKRGLGSIAEMAVYAGIETQSDANAAFIARARTLGPLIAQALVEAREREGRLREILEFDCTCFPDMEAKAVEIAMQIAGRKGAEPDHPDPVRLLEMCADIAKAALRDMARAALTEGQAALAQENEP